jgi:hypothetical protein
MSAQHTRGPWNVQPDSKLFAKIGSQANGGIYVAKVQGPDTEANARLIAAAPELLDALRAVYEAMPDVLQQRGLLGVVTGALVNASAA